MMTRRILLVLGIGFATVCCEGCAKSPLASLQRKTLEHILTAKMSPADREAALQRYVRVGDHVKSVEPILPPCRSTCAYEASVIRVYRVGDPDLPALTLCCRGDGEIHMVFYRSEANEENFLYPK